MEVCMSECESVFGIAEKLGLVVDYLLFFTYIST